MCMFINLAWLPVSTVKIDGVNVNGNNSYVKACHNVAYAADFLLIIFNVCYALFDVHFSAIIWPTVISELVYHVLYRYLLSQAC